MQDFEKLGLFYLGKPVDVATGATIDEPLLYDSRDLVTHAVCLGMTGSGKTGLGIALLEEAAIDGGADRQGPHRAPRERDRAGRRRLR